jgi:hypothetical protein
MAQSCRIVFGYKRFFTLLSQSRHAGSSITVTSAPITSLPPAPQPPVVPPAPTTLALSTSATSSPAPTGLTASTSTGSSSGDAQASNDATGTGTATVVRAAVATVTTKKARPPPLPSPAEEAALVEAATLAIASDHGIIDRCELRLPLLQSLTRLLAYGGQINSIASLPTTTSIVDGTLTISSAGGGIACGSDGPDAVFRFGSDERIFNVVKRQISPMGYTWTAWLRLLRTDDIQKMLFAFINSQTGSGVQSFMIKNSLRIRVLPDSGTKTFENVHFHIGKSITLLGMKVVIIFDLASFSFNRSMVFHLYCSSTSLTKTIKR